MRPNNIVSLAFWAILSRETVAISITTTNDASTLAAAIFNSPGVTVNSASFVGAAAAAGTFTNGPFGIGSGAILTSGTAAGALVGGNTFVNNGASGSADWCGANTFDGSILMVNVNVDAGYTGVLVNFILGSEDAGQVADRVGIWLDGTQYAKDASGNQITSLSNYIRSPIYITKPNDDMSYAAASPPLIFSIPASPGQHTMVFAMCDTTDHDYDSGLLVNARGCAADCPASIAINYVTTTTTVAATESLGTQTIKASYTTSGTFIVRVAAPTTTSESSTSSTESSTSSTETESSTSSTENFPSSTESSPSSTETESSASSVETESSTVSTESETASTSSDFESTVSAEPSTASAEPSTTDSSSTDISTTYDSSSDPTVTPTPTSSSSEEPEPSFWTETDDMTSTTSSSQEFSTETASDSQTETSTTESLTETPTESASESSSDAVSTITASDSTTESVASTSTDPQETPTASPESTESPTSSTESSTYITEDPSLEPSSSQTPTVTSEIATESQSSKSQTESAESPTTSSEVPISSTSTSAESETASFEPSPLIPTSSSETSTPSPPYTNSTSDQSPETPTPSGSTEPGLPPQPTLPPFTNGTTTSGGQTPGSETSTATPVSSSPAAASNLPTIGGYQYVGCLTPDVSAGFLFFNEVLTADDMTTAQCVSLAGEHPYIGLFNTSCYVADTLEATEFIPNGRCDLPCPGDPGLFCGGLINPPLASGLEKRGEAFLDRRAVPYGILLTIYALPGAVPEPPAFPPTTSGFEFSSTTTTTTVSTSPVTPPSSEAGLPTLLPDGTSTTTSTISSGVLPPVTGIATTIITVTYTTVCPTNPASLVLTETCVTLPYYPCQRCANHGIPTVEMITTAVNCMACGHNGEDRVTLTVPKAGASASPAAAVDGADGLPDVTAPRQDQGGGGAQPTRQGEQAGTALPPGAVPAPAETEKAVATGLVNSPGASTVVTAVGSRSSVCWVMVAAFVGFMGML
ncbi:hypothetical protein GE09DRAFT_536426 [Coniochaeta sp. 2T2.1]|nr:hypothetical protein GE09DRAFT_536426 [Coniochaeta sp. 2T2.1]